MGFVCTRCSSSMPVDERCEACSSTDASRREPVIVEPMEQIGDVVPKCVRRVCLPRGMFDVGA